MFVSSRHIIGVEARNAQLLDAQSQLLKHLEEHRHKSAGRGQSRVALKRTTCLLRWVDGDVLSSSVMTPSLLARAGSFWETLEAHWVRPPSLTPFTSVGSEKVPGRRDLR